MDLRAEMFDGETLAGPVPNIFAHDRQEALDGLLANPELALADIVQLNERFLQMEHITLAEAVTFHGKGGSGQPEARRPSPRGLPASRRHSDPGAQQVRDQRQVRHSRKYQCLTKRIVYERKINNVTHV